LKEEKICYKMIYQTLHLGLSQSSGIALESLQYYIILYQYQF